MLSLIDLIDAGTVNLPLAAYLAATMRAGASHLVGARPGGAGKTAVMCALLNFLPDQTEIQPVAGQSVLEAGLRDTNFGHTCYLAHEIGAGYYYAYIWGQEARAFFNLAARGHIVASNLHADTLEETRAQLCDENGVAPAHLDAITLKVYLRVRRARDWSMDRWISRVYENDGTGDRLLWVGERPGQFTRQAKSSSKIITPEQEATYAQFLTRLLNENTRHIDAVRRALLE